MRRAAANAARDGGAEAAAAQQRLEEALERLARNQAGRGDRDIKSAMRKADELANEQKEITSEVQRLDQEGAARDARVQQLGARKDAMESKLAGLEQQLQQLADETHADQRETSRKLHEAAGSIRDNKIKEKIRYSKGMIQGQPTEYTKAFEENIGENLETLKKKIGDAADALGKASKQGQLSRALEQTRDLVRGAESLNQRMRESSQQQGRAGQPGQQQQGQAGRPGQAGQQGQQADARGQSGNQFTPPQGGAARDARPNGAAGPSTGPKNNDARQFGRELRELTGNAEEIRRRLAEAGVNARDLESVIQELRGVTAGGDPRGLQQLQAAVDHLKRFEFELRKKAGTDNQHLFLSGSDEVPAGFRQAIEEYYRALAKKGSK
jgi:hypothetical protein